MRELKAYILTGMEGKTRRTVHPINQSNIIPTNRANETEDDNDLRTLKSGTHSHSNTHNTVYRVELQTLLPFFFPPHFWRVTFRRASNGSVKTQIKKGSTFCPQFNGHNMFSEPLLHRMTFICEKKCP